MYTAQLLRMEQQGIKRPNKQEKGEEDTSIKRNKQMEVAAKPSEMFGFGEDDLTVIDMEIELDAEAQHPIVIGGGRRPGISSKEAADIKTKT